MKMVVGENSDTEKFKGGAFLKSEKGGEKLAGPEPNQMSRKASKQIILRVDKFAGIQKGNIWS